MLEVLLILVLPLFAFAIQMFFGRRLPRGGDWVSLLAIGVAFLLSLRYFARAFSAFDPNYMVLHERFTWIDLSVAQITVGDIKRRPVHLGQ